MSVRDKLLNTCYKWRILPKPSRITNLEAELIVDSDEVREDIKYWLEEGESIDRNLGQFILNRHIREAPKDHPSTDFEVAVRLKAIQLAGLSLHAKNPARGHLKKEHQFRMDVEPIDIDIVKVGRGEVVKNTELA